MGIKEDRVLVVDPKVRAAEQLLKRLGVAIKTFGLYPQQHPMVARAMKSLLGSLRPFMEAYGPFVARISKHGFVVDGVTFEGEAAIGLALYLFIRKLAVLTILPAVAQLMPLWLLA